MKEKETLPPDTVALLRAPLPEADARPGFETRLLANLQEAPPKPSLFPRLAVASLGLLLLLGYLVFVQLQAPSPEGTVVAIPDMTVTPSTLEVSELLNPLETEAQAMRTTANRAGLFLLSHLPTLPEGEGTL